MKVASNQHNPPLSEGSVNRILMIVPDGQANEFVSIIEALQFLDTYSISDKASELKKYEVYIEFADGDKLHVALLDKKKVQTTLNYAATR